MSHLSSLILLSSHPLIYQPLTLSSLTLSSINISTSDLSSLYYLPSPQTSVICVLLLRAAAPPTIIRLAVRIVDAIHTQKAPAATTEFARLTLHLLPLLQSARLPRCMAMAMKPAKYKMELSPSTAKNMYGCVRLWKKRGLSSRYRIDTTEMMDAESKKSTDLGGATDVFAWYQCTTESGQRRISFIWASFEHDLGMACPLSRLFT